MNRIQTAFVQALSVICLGLILPASAAPQSASNQDNLTIVDPPGGGEYVYGNLPGKGTMLDAFVYMLTQVHGHFGNRPDVGKFFQSRGDGSVATFFSVTAKNQANKPMSGLLIVSHAQDGSASAAVLYDDASRFGTTEPQMLRALSAAWHPAGSAASSGGQPAPSRPSAPAQLHPVTGGDRSAVVSLPDGWKLTGVSGGSLTATGANSEMLSLGLIYQNLPFYVQGDLFTAFVNANNMRRQQNGLSPATYNVTSRMNLPGNAIQVIYNVDLNDGVGPRKGSARVGFLGPHAIMVSASNIPARFAAQENDMMLAVIHSYSQNAAVIAREGQADLNRVHADADRGAAQAAALNQRREAQTGAFDQHMSDLNRANGSFDQHLDDIDRGSKMTEDYILDRSVVRDDTSGDRGTVSNAYADSLVKANPDRFQVIGNQDMIKGQDY